MRSSIIFVFICGIQLCLNVPLSFGSSVKPVYQALDASLRKHSMVKEVAYRDDGPRAPERRKRQSAGDGSPTPTPTPTPAVVDEVTDSHDYYSSTFIRNGQDHFVDLATDDRTVVLHTGLSESHLKAGEVQLPFQFPFYGHNVTKIYIATGGFLSSATFFHQYLSATQYIAPLMGNFDPSLNGSSQIRYAYNDTTFTVEWDEIHINHLQDAGRFTFQTTLASDGRIIFAYNEVPLSVKNITGGNGHKVVVGLSDGYYIDEPLYPGSYLVRRTIYHYSIVSLNETAVQSGSAYILTPLQTCNIVTNCSSCLAVREEILFDCGWCEELKRCSDGLDRHRQEWVESDCPENSQDHCPNNDVTSTTSYNSVPMISTNDYEIRAAFIIIGVIICFFIFAACGWLVYAYKNPSSRSGQQLVTLGQRVRRPRRNPQDNYGESIVGNMQESKPTSPPPYTPPQDFPAIPTPPITDTPPVVTTTGEPGAVILTGNGAVSANAAMEGKVEFNANADTAEC